MFTRRNILIALVLPIGLLPAAILGLFAYMNATKTPLHPDPQAVPSVAHAAPVPKLADAVERARRIVRAGLAEQNLPGVSVAVGVGGDLAWAEGFGYADLEEQARVTPATRFHLGTASTMLTSAAVGLLIEQKRLKLDDEIQAYVPGFPKKQWPVTLRQVMGHTAGVRNDAGDEENVFDHCETAGEGVQRFADRSLLFEPGTRYRYSSYGWILVSAAVEAAANQPFFSFMRTQVFEPAGMQDTSLDDAASGSPERATFYFPKFAADPRYGPQPPDEVDFSCFSGASGFVTTASDLVRFGIAVNRGTLVQPATVQLLQAPQRLASGEDTGYGLGWDLETVALAGEQRRLVVHDGTLRDGMVASFITFPERGIVVAILANTAFADTASLALSVAEAFAGHADKPPAR